MEIIARYGNKDPITEGGGRVFDTSNGPFFEYTEGTETDGNLLEVYRTHLGEDLRVQFAHLLDNGGLEELCEVSSLSLQTWQKKAKGRLSLRAQCVVDLASHFGWDSIDDEPLLLSQIELQLRWFHKFQYEGPVTTEGCEDPRVIVPEMVVVLQEVAPQEYEKLFSRPFPFIPSEALQNCQNSWWEQHGSAAVADLIKALQKACPPGFVFAREEAQWGFWPVDGS